MNKSINKRTVDSTKPGTKDLFIWDTALRGFGLKTTPTGSKIYILQYRINGQLRRYTIGKHGMWTPDSARKEAKNLLGQVAKDEDPAEKKQSDKTYPTVKIFASKYLEEYAQVEKKPRSIQEDRRNLANHVIPAIGTRRIDLIGRAEIQKKIHHPLRKAPIAANRVRSLLLTMFNLAEEWGDRPIDTNPIRRIKKYKEHKRQRRLSKEELVRLGAVLKKVEQNGTHSPSVIGAIRLLLFTGARKDEILTLKWAYVDVQRANLHLPDSKTGEKDIPLNPQALRVLRSLSRIIGNPYVLPGQKRVSHLVNLDAPWFQIRKEAKLEDVRIHDLRHTFASVGRDAGIDLTHIGGILGHTEIATTQRYAHLDEEPKKQAANRIGAEISAALDGPKGKPPPILHLKGKLKIK